MVNSSPALCPPTASSNPPSLTAKCLQTLLKVPGRQNHSGCKSPLQSDWNHIKYPGKTELTGNVQIQPFGWISSLSPHKRQEKPIQALAALPKVPSGLGGIRTGAWHLLSNLPAGGGTVVLAFICKFPESTSCFLSNICSRWPKDGRCNF